MRQPGATGNRRGTGPHGLAEVQISLTPGQLLARTDRAVLRAFAATAISGATVRYGFTDSTLAPTATLIRHAERHLRQRDVGPCAGDRCVRQPLRGNRQRPVGPRQPRAAVSGNDRRPGLSSSGVVVLAHGAGASSHRNVVAGSDQQARFWRPDRALHVCLRKQPRLAPRSPEQSAGDTAARRTLRELRRHRRALTQQHRIVRPAGSDRGGLIDTRWRERAPRCA